MSYVKLYKPEGILNPDTTPTRGGVDGIEVTQTHLSPPTEPVYTATILAGQIGNPIKLAIRVPDVDGKRYKTDPTQSIVITPVLYSTGEVGGTYDMWALAPNHEETLPADDIPGTFGEWGASYTIAAPTYVDNTNFIFWIKARAGAEEVPINDITVSLKIVARILAVDITS